MPTNAIILHPSSKFFFFLATVRHHFRKSWPIRLQSCGASFQRIYLQPPSSTHILKAHPRHTHLPKAQGNAENRGQEGCKNQRLWMFAARLHLLVTLHTHEVSPTWLPKCELSRNDTNGHAQVDREAHEASTLHKELRQPKNGRIGTHWYSPVSSLLEYRFSKCIPMIP